jgi:chromosome segregation ATPase
MKPIYVIAFAVVTWSLSSCDLNEKKRMQASIDSLQTELTASKEVAKTLDQVGVLLDSIDESRHVLRTQMVEGTSYDNYLARLENVNDYIKNTYEKIAKLETALSKSKSASATYLSSIKKLKAELEVQTAQVAALSQEVEKIKSENQQLTASIQQKDAELTDKLNLIQVKEQDIAALEKQVEDITRQSVVDHAEAYYREAMALETAAQRTKFAPRKKKKTEQEALEYYKMAASLGKTEAQDRIALLEKKN